MIFYFDIINVISYEQIIIIVVNNSKSCNSLMEVNMKIQKGDLNKFEIFKELKKQTIEQLTNMATIVVLRKGHRLFTEREKVNTMLK